MSAQECTQCAAGSYSLGSGIRFDQWDAMPAGFSSLAATAPDGGGGGGAGADDGGLLCNRSAPVLLRVSESNRGRLRRG